MSEHSRSPAWKWPCQSPSRYLGPAMARMHGSFSIPALAHKGHRFEVTLRKADIDLLAWSQIEIHEQALVRGPSQSNHVSERCVARLCSDLEAGHQAALVNSVVVVGAARRRKRICGRRREWLWSLYRKRGLSIRRGALLPVVKRKEAYGQDHQPKPCVTQSLALPGKPMAMTTKFLWVVLGRLSSILTHVIAIYQSHPLPLFCSGTSLATYPKRALCHAKNPSPGLKRSGNRIICPLMLAMAACK